MGKLTGKVAFITGAAMGIGEGIALVCARHGADVILADISDKTADVAKKIEAIGQKALTVRLDVLNPEEVKQAVAAGTEKFGKIDILINNAGVIKLDNFLDMSDEIRDFQLDVNVKGSWNCSKAVLPQMVERKYGKIVFMSSVTGTVVADPGETAYATGKAAIFGLMKSLAREMAPNGINVNAICPGYVQTPMAENIAKESNPNNPGKVIEGIAAAVPLGRLATPEEIGELAAFLSSDEASYIVGTAVTIDGGSTLPETVSVGV